MSAAGPRGRTTRRPLAGLHAGASLLHGIAKKVRRLGGLQLARAKVATFDQPAGAQIPWSITRPPGVDSQHASEASQANAELADLDLEADSFSLLFYILRSLSEKLNTNRWATLRFLFLKLRNHR